MSAFKIVLRSRATRLITAALARVGLAIKTDRLVKASEAELKNLVAMLYAERSKPAAPDDPAIECVVFSKDRPTQLAALLSSINEKVAPDFPVHVLYRASSEAFTAAYVDVLRSVAKSNVIPHAEQNFSRDLRRLLADIKAPKMFFLVDDDLFLEDVSVAAFGDVDLARFVPSLRLGRNLRHCFPINAQMPLPPFQDDVKGRKGFLAWRWRDGSMDWAYPMSVTGHIFRTEEIRIMTEAATFVAPNSYEEALTHFTACFADRFGLCFEKSRLVNIPANLVQTENASRAHNLSVEYLLERWNAGYAIDHRSLYGVSNRSAHQAFDLTFVTRST